jgi:3-hydroxybutyryl-CoA dehydrogenase
MNLEDVKKIVVVGAGQMGAGIAQVAAQSGFEVLLIDSWSDAIDRAFKTMEKSLLKLKEKALLQEEPAKVLARVKAARSLAEVRNFAPQMVIEAVTENIEIKSKIFQELDTLLPPDVVFCSNTSSISITKLAASTRRAERFMGMHFMNPVPLMKLVELIEGLGTSVETAKLVRAVAEKMSKTCVISKDRAGFIINRILMPMINESFYVLQEGIGTAEDIDTGMKLGTNQPMGPLVLADFIGLDTCLSIMEVLHKYLGDDKYRPAPLLRQYVEAGWLGRKSGRGVYTYC